jgi:hypothetical protein
VRQQQKALAVLNRLKSQVESAIAAIEADCIRDMTPEDQSKWFPPESDYDIFLGDFAVKLLKKEDQMT